MVLDQIKKCARRAVRAMSHEAPASETTAPATCLSHDQLIISEHLAGETPRKLHIGCGHNVIEGWLNSDYDPAAAQVIHLDAASAFPFEDNQFDFIFSEHMIEHLTFPDGMKMLAECHRVLKPGGTMRITTPDLSFLMELYGNHKSKLQQEYIKWSTDTFIAGASGYEDVFVINNFVRDWGHQFIYDHKTLRAAMEKSGFTNITECQINESQDKELQNLENEDRMPPGLLKLESMVWEGSKLLEGSRS